MYKVGAGLHRKSRLCRLLVHVVCFYFINAINKILKLTHTFSTFEAYILCMASLLLYC